MNIRTYENFLSFLFQTQPEQNFYIHLLYNDIFYQYTYINIGYN